MISKNTMNEIIDRLNHIARDHDSYEYGLPVMDEGQKSLMREAIREAIEEEDANGGFLIRGKEANEMLEKLRKKEGGPVSKNLYGCDNPVGFQSEDPGKRFFKPN
jgi:hypothetical protein